MLAITDIQLQVLATHFVGNKATGEHLALSNQPIAIDTAELKQTLLQYLLTPFQEDGSYHLWHPSELRLNVIYSYASRIFDDPSNFLGHSQSIARHLHDVTDLPQIKSSELHIAYFTGVPYNGIMTDAIGIYKTDREDTFLKIRPTGLSYEFQTDTGINPEKMDKGCLIINTASAEGYTLHVVDKSAKGSQAQFWKDTFLKVRASEDPFHTTNDYMKMCKDFVMEQVPSEFEVSRTEQIDFLNKTSDYFKKNEQFERKEFEQSIFKQPELIESFNNYSRLFVEDYETKLPDQFDISGPAVKKQAKFFKSVLKLDKNFHVYVHGNTDLIEKGFDAALGMNYYKIFFENEA